VRCAGDRRTSACPTVAETDPAWLKTFARNLERERDRAGLSQDQLALKAGLARTTPSLYENCDREPKLGQIVRLAQAMEIPAGRLLRGL
jgi:transcriptional regulator with XRE-family HTH domain